MDEPKRMAVDQREMAMHPALFLLILTALGFGKIADYAGFPEEAGRKALHRKVKPNEQIFGQVSCRKHFRINEPPWQRHTGAKQLPRQAKACIPIGPEIILNP